MNNYLSSELYTTTVYGILLHMNISSQLLRTITIVLLIASAHCLMAQGPWSPGKGHGYAQLLYNTVPTYTALFNGSNSTRASERELSETDYILYSEVGLTEKLSFAATIPVISVSTGAPNQTLMTEPLLPADNLTSLGNISLTGKYNLTNKKWNVALISQVDLPTSSRTEDSGLSTGVDAWSIQPKISAGKSSETSFVYGFFGYGVRNNAHHDFLNFGVEAGFHAGKNLSLILNINRLHNLDNGDPSVDSAANVSTGFYTSFQEYTGYILKIFLKDLYKGFGGFASLGGGGAANSVAASPALSLGVFYKW